LTISSAADGKTNMPYIIVILATLWLIGSVLPARSESLSRTEFAEMEKGALCFHALEIALRHAPTTLDAAEWAKCRYPDQSLTADEAQKRFGAYMMRAKTAIDDVRRVPAPGTLKCVEWRADNKCLRSEHVVKSATKHKLPFLSDGPGAWQGCLMGWSNPVYNRAYCPVEDPIAECDVPSEKIGVAVSAMFNHNPDWVEKFCRRGVNRVEGEYEGRTYQMHRTCVNRFC